MARKPADGRVYVRKSDSPKSAPPRPDAPDPRRPAPAAAPRPRTARSAGAASRRRSPPARAAAKPRRNRPRLRQSLGFGKHAKSLRFRLAPFFRLDASPRPARPAPGPPGSRPLCRRLRLRGDRGKTQLGRHPGAADLGAAVEFRAARRNIRPRRPPRRHRPRRRPPHPGAAAGAERSDPARGSHGDDRDARSRRSTK